jgi:hypothetical protein
MRPDLTKQASIDEDQSSVDVECGVGKQEYGGSPSSSGSPQRCMGVRPEMKEVKSGSLTRAVFISVAK